MKQLDFSGWAPPAKGNLKLFFLFLDKLLNPVYAG